jgi:rhodanese-related sulfurtransferase
MNRIISMLTVLFVLAATPLFADSVPKMDKEVLKSLLGSKDLVILDARQDRDWNTSELKIQDAIRVDDGDLSFAMKLPKETTMVLYCA